MFDPLIQFLDTVEEEDPVIDKPPSDIEEYIEKELEEEEEDEDEEDSE